MNKLFVLLFVIVTLLFAEYGSVLVSKVNRVYDGDTFYANIDAWPDIIGKDIGIRINGINCPEVRTRSKREKAEGVKIRAFADSLIGSAKVIILRNVDRPKFFRVLADVEIDGQDYAKILIDKGYAKPYDGGKKQPWFKKEKVEEPKKVVDVPEKVVDVPEKVSDAPEKVSDVPKKAIEGPKQVEEQPKK